MSTLENLERIAAEHRLELLLATRALRRAESALAEGKRGSSQKRLERARARFDAARLPVDELESTWGSLVTDRATVRRYRAIDRLIASLKRALAGGSVRPDVAALLAKNVARSMRNLAAEIEAAGGKNV